jgi:sugar phosphate isomerase/epimerase
MTVTDRFVISGFGDEIATGPDEQLAVLGRLGIRHLDLRRAWGRGVLDLDNADVRSLQGLLQKHGARVSTIASPIGKSEIDQDAAYERERLDVALRLAETFETPYIRIFSFYHANLDHAACRDEVLRRLGGFAKRAEQAGATLLLENEGDLWGDTPECCRDLIETIGSPALKLSLDTGNFAVLGVRPYDDAYPLLKQHIVHVQIKDARTRDRVITVAGEGDGQIPELLAALQRDGYRGYLSLEPHLMEAGKASGFSGSELFGRAAEALKGLVAALAEEGR